MWLRVLVIFLLFLLVAPVFVMIPLSFNSGVTFYYPLDGLSFRWYQNFIENEQWLNGFFISLKVAVLTAIFSTAVGLMAALAVDRLSFPGKKIFQNLIIAPIIIPVIIVGVALYRSFSVFSITNTTIGLVLAHSVLAIPLVFITISARLKSVDRNLELAAQSMGSSPIRAFFNVTFPLIGTSVFAGFLFSFITSLDEVVVSIFVSGANTKTLPIVMWDNMRTQIDPTIAAVSSIMIFIVVILFLLFPGLIQSGQKGK